KSPRDSLELVHWRAVKARPAHITRASSGLERGRAGETSEIVKPAQQRGANVMDGTEQNRHGEAQPAPSRDNSTDEWAAARWPNQICHRQQTSCRARVPRARARRRAARLRT